MTFFNAQDKLARSVNQGQTEDARIVREAAAHQAALQKLDQALAQIKNDYRSGATSSRIVSASWNDTDGTVISNNLAALITERTGLAATVWTSGDCDSQVIVSFSE